VIDTFDRWLEEELSTGFTPFASALLPAGAPYRAGGGAGRGRGARRVASRGAVAAGAVFLGLATSCVLAAAAFSGSPDPRVWSRDVSEAIATCSAQVGIGTCMKAIGHSLHDGSGPGAVTPGRSKALPEPGSTVVPGAQPSDVAHGNAAVVPQPGASDKPGGRPATPPGSPPAAMPNGEPNGLAKGNPTGGHGKPPAKPTPHPRKR